MKPTDFLQWIEVINDVFPNTDDHAELKTNYGLVKAALIGVVAGTSVNPEEFRKKAKPIRMTLNGKPVKTHEAKNNKRTTR